MQLRSFPALFAASLCSVAVHAGVRVWETNVAIPTYLAAPPSPVPRFYEGRTYQGARATFYPYPVQDVLTDIKTNQTYKVLFLENDYLQISVLPELGGRIFSAVDKSNGYDFFYRQHVIKPALIGMQGAWISGGVEWNVPHHHRASSFSPVDYTTQTNADGSATIWVGEIEFRHRMKWLVGMTLYPDRSYLELTCRMFNRSPFAQSMLFWINPAVHANENYQVIFPPDAEWAVQHGKPEFAGWPIAHEKYGGTDYTRGVDISWWKNHVSPVSFFCFHSEQDFFGGYDHGKQAGVLHIADHNVVPGKKFFEWGNGPEAEMWSKILTDDDGPYLELMAGAWSDNQPDYSWIQPGETREWQHWWYPIRELGGVKAANKDAAVNIEVTNGVVTLTVNTTAALTNVDVELRFAKTNAVWGTTTNISPQQPFRVQLCMSELGLNESFLDRTGVDVTVRPEMEELTVRRRAVPLVSYFPEQRVRSEIPKPVERPKPPKDYASADELYFTGQRIEQLLSPSFEARPYYEEMLRRDAGDCRAHTALGILLCKQWRWDEAAKHLSNAIARATANYIRPKDTEAFYYLGVALKAQNKLDDARDAFEKAVWSPAWQGSSYFELAQIKLRRRDFDGALSTIERSLSVNARNNDARSFRANLLDVLGRTNEARLQFEAVLRDDPLDFLALHGLVTEELAGQYPRGEGAKLCSDAARLWQRMLRGNDGAVLELLNDDERLFPFTRLPTTYQIWNRAAWNVAGDCIQCLATTEKAERNPVLLYGLTRGGREFWTSMLQGQAKTNPASSFFPFQWESEPGLRNATEKDPADALAPYLLGCLLYDNQPENAIKAWEEARKRDDKFALTHRNLALAYAQHEKDIPKAIASLEKAVELDATEPRYFFELDRLYEANGTPVAKRLDTLTRHHDVVAKRDDALAREIALLLAASQPGRALEFLTQRRFHNWEGSGEIHRIYADARVQKGRTFLRKQQWEAAQREFAAALEYPENLEVGRPQRESQTARVNYFLGLAYEGAGDKAKAESSWRAASESADRAASEAGYYRALALKKLGQATDTRKIFDSLIEAGEAQAKGKQTEDYFAKFGERQAERVRQAQGHFLAGLGYAGLGRASEAKTSFQRALEFDPAHLGARLELAELAP